MPSNRRHAITPTDRTAPNPDWEYSPPSVSKDGKTVSIDAHQITMIHDQYRAFGVPLVDADTQGRRR